MNQNDRHCMLTIGNTVGYFFYLGMMTAGEVLFLITYVRDVAKVPAWYSGNALDSINVVSLRRAQLVPGWVTVFGRVKFKPPRHRIKHPG